MDALCQCVGNLLDKNPFICLPEWYVDDMESNDTRAVVIIIYLVVCGLSV